MAERDIEREIERERERESEIEREIERERERNVVLCSMSMRDRTLNGGRDHHGYL